MAEPLDVVRDGGDGLARRLHDLAGRGGTLLPFALGSRFDLTLRLQHALNEAETKLAAANQQVEVAEKAYKAFEDEARRNGVPSSWLE